VFFGARSFENHDFRTTFTSRELSQIFKKSIFFALFLSKNVKDYQKKRLFNLRFIVILSTKKVKNTCHKLRNRGTAAIKNLRNHQIPPVNCKILQNQSPRITALTHPHGRYKEANVEVCNEETRKDICAGTGNIGSSVTMAPLTACVHYAASPFVSGARSVIWDSSNNACQPKSKTAADCSTPANAATKKYAELCMSTDAIVTVSVQNPMLQQNWIRIQVFDAKDDVMSTVTTPAHTNADRIEPESKCVYLF